jgi:hypothetical protein
MNELSQQKEIVKLEKQLNDETLASELRGLTKKELEFKLLELAKHAQEIVTTRNSDEELTDAKNVVKELSAPYNDQLKGNKLMSRFIHLLVKEKEEV